VWLPKPPSASQLAWLESQCHKLHVYTPPPQWRLPCVRLQLKRPSRAALEFIENIPGARVNAIECALDWVFATIEERDQAYEFECAHKLKKRLRRDPKSSDNWHYTDKEGAATNLVTYKRDYCKLTGELHCLHHELRITGSRAMRRHVLSLLKLDLPALWNAWAFLYEPDFTQLGRMVGNISLRRRKLIARRTSRSRDLLIGGMAYAACGRTVQGLVNQYRKHIEVMRCLHPLDMSHLIPKQGGYYFFYNKCCRSDDTPPTILKHNENSGFVPVSYTNFSQSIASRPDN
jgi:hypothetical protein